MNLTTLFLLFGIGIWNPGLESVIYPESIILQPLPKEWHEEIPLSAKAVIVVDIDSMGILYQKNKDTPLPMASLTKMMTALIIIENHHLSEKVTIPSLSEYIEGSTMKLRPGDVITISDLLKGLMLNSGNDAATVLALYHSGTVFEFVKEMNTRAKQLGMQDTHFQNPHGLDAPKHYASAHDLAILSKAILLYPFLRNVANQATLDVLSENGGKYELLNTNQLLDSPFPVYGLKTGTTENAKECLALLTRVHGKESLVIILGSHDRYFDAKTLLWHIMGKKEE